MTKQLRLSITLLPGVRRVVYKYPDLHSWIGETSHSTCNCAFNVYF